MGVVGTLDKPYDLLLGRKTYDIFASYWPYVPADNQLVRSSQKRTNTY